MPQWLGGDGFDVAIPGAEAITHKILAYCNVGQDLQEMLQVFQCGRSKGLHLSVQILRWLLEGKRQIKMEDAFRAHMPCTSGR